MPSSCLAPPVAGHPVTGDVSEDFSTIRAACGALAEYPDQVVDHRPRQGLRYEWGFLLAVVVATACAGHDEVAAAAQWAADAPELALTALGAKPGTVALSIRSTRTDPLARPEAT